jgi:ribosomal protein S18 acetylase RimI-like enzyme
MAGAERELALPGVEVTDHYSGGRKFMPASIQAATDFDANQLVATAVLAFGSDPIVRWGIADPHQYLTRYPDVVRVFSSKAIQNHTAYYADAFAGVALWLPPGVSFDAQALVGALQSAVPEALQGDAFAVLEQMGNYHPKEPHWYLPLMGVEPRHQRQGVGSALMKHALVECDRDRSLAYLEASSPENLALYERHGFEVLGTIQVGSSPPIFPMVRGPG